jgi:hypothetical protein
LDAINPAKCTEFDYINFLIASLRVFSCTEASKSNYLDTNVHLKLTILLLACLPDSLWIRRLYGEGKKLFPPEIGLLIIDNVPDKPHSKNIDLVYRQRRGKHHQIVNEINLETVFWTNNGQNTC